MPFSRGEDRSAHMTAAIAAAFKAFDLNNDNKVSEEEFIKIMTRPTGFARPKTIDQAKEIFKEFDINKDGVVDLAEFTGKWGPDENVFWAAKSKSMICGQKAAHTCDFNKDASALNAFMAVGKNNVGELGQYFTDGGKVDVIFKEDSSTFLTAAVSNTKGCSTEVLKLILDEAEKQLKPEFESDPNRLSFEQFVNFEDKHMYIDRGATVIRGGATLENKWYDLGIDWPITALHQLVAIQIAARSDSAGECLKLLLKCPNIDVGKKSPFEGQTALDMALQVKAKVNTQVVDEMIKALKAASS